MIRLFFLAAILIASNVKAQDTAKADIGLIQATVYLGYGAELVHQTKLKVDADTRTIVLNGLSTNVDMNSLQISCPENVAILSYQFKLFTPIVPNPEKNPTLVRMEDSIKSLQKEIARTDNLISIEQETLKKTGALIETTFSTNGNKTVESAEVLKLIEYYNKKIETSKTAIFQYSQKKDEMNNLIYSIQTRMSLFVPPSSNNKPTGQLTMQVMCKGAQDMPVAVSYYTPNAGWTAFYDIRVNSKTNKVKMIYKASLTQSTGVDWKKTKLTLSTGTPTFGVAAPDLSPWYLQLYVPSIYKDLQGKVPGVVSQNQMPLMNDDKSLSEVVVTGMGIKEKSKSLGYSTQTIDPSTLQQYTQMNRGQLNNNYDIELPYDIASDGELHSVTIKDQEVDCSLKNYAVPKLLRETYLLAEVANWQNLDLLPGNANIIMDETYIGKTLIDPNTTDDTLNLSLGKDSRVSIDRTLVKELSGLKTSGGNSKQTYTYEITVKNNKLTDVSMLLKDQYPLSNIKEIEVKLEDDGDAEVNSETGTLSWKLNLKPGESKKMRFSYSIKFPKDKKIINPK